MIYRPTRPKDVNLLKGYAEKMLASTGHEEITFSSLSSSDYEELPELTDCLIEKMDNEHVNISLFSGCHEQDPGCEEEFTYICP